MINLEIVIQQLAGNAVGFGALIETVTAEQEQWKPDSETWSMKEVMAHVYNEERMDFRLHLKEMLNDPPQAWGERREAYLPVENCRQALESFLAERKASIDWLKEQSSANWDTESRATFGPSEEVVVLRAGDVLVSWVAHDYLHLRQMIELLFAWNEKQALPYAVPYAGGW